MELATDLGPLLLVGDTELILAMFPSSRHEDDCLFIIGTFLELVDSEVISNQKVLLLDTFLGVLKARIVCI